MLKCIVWFGLILWHINHCRLFNAESSLYIYIKYIRFGLDWFYCTSNIVGYSMPNPFHTYVLNIYDLVWIYGTSTLLGYLMPRIWYGLVLWHINHRRLFNAKSYLFIYIKYIGFGLVGFYGISTIVGYLMPNPLYTYILNIYDLVWIGFMAHQTL